jgi:membrane protein DedA with SNARE-associated domain
VSLPDLLAAAGSTKPLPGALHHVEGVLRDYGYLAVGVTLFGENLGLPFPGETILVAAALDAGTGRLNIWLVCVVSVACSVLGAAAGYAIGAKGGRRLLERFGRYVFVTPERLDRLEKFFERRGAWLVIGGRFIEGARQVMGIVAGISEMTFKRFIVFTTIGATVWTAAWASVGYFAGDHVETITRYFTWIAIGVAGLALSVVLWRVRRHRQHRNA